MENGRFEKRKMRTENADLRMRASTMELNRLIRMKVNLSVDWQLVFLARAKLFLIRVCITSAFLSLDFFLSIQLLDHVYAIYYPANGRYVVRAYVDK